MRWVWIGVLTLAGCLDTVDENAWKGRDGLPDAPDAPTVDVRGDAAPDGAMKALASLSELVSSRANIYGAGHGQPPAPAGGGPGQLPVAIALPVGVDRVVQLTKVSGTISYFDGDPPKSADGEPSPGIEPLPTYGGLSGFITRDLLPGLTAVFLDDVEPQDPPPASLDVGDATFSELSPGLRQIFWMGDGLTGTGSGATQRFHVPSGATRLFLGVTDRLYDSGSLPGFYQDNTGSFQVDGEILGR